MTARFIVLEGLDGAGTTTQRGHLAGRLKQAGHRVVQTQEPTQGPFGRLARRALQNHPGAPALATLPWLFAADRSDHLDRTIEPALRAGSWVLSDRYYHSSLVYQSMTLPMRQLLAINEPFRVPDLTLYLRIDVDTALQRIHKRGHAPELYEQRQTLTTMHQRYEQAMRLLTDRGDPIVAIDGSGSIEAVTQAIWQHVQPLQD